MLGEQQPGEQRNELPVVDPAAASLTRSITIPQPAQPSTPAIISGVGLPAHPSPPKTPEADARQPVGSSARASHDDLPCR